MRRWHPRVGGDLLGALLFGAVIAPAVTALRVGGVYTLSMVLVSLMVALVLGGALARLPSPDTGARPSTADLTILASLTLAAAVLIGATVHYRSNAFYTPQALYGGMIVLLALYVADRALRAVAMRDARRLRARHHMLRPGGAHDGVALDHLPPNEIRSVQPGMISSEPTEPLGGTPSATLPALVTSDALSGLAAWLLVMFWLLVALEHRHPASVILLAVGGLLLLSNITLLPVVLSSRV